MTTQCATVTPEAHRLRALARANEIRIARAELKRRIADGVLAAPELILDPPSAAESWSVGELLMSQRGWGAARCRRFLARSQINERKPVGELTQRQRLVLAAELRAFVALAPGARQLTHS
jgi:hypothetical protein